LGRLRELHPSGSLASPKSIYRKGTRWYHRFLGPGDSLEKSSLLTTNFHCLYIGNITTRRLLLDEKVDCQISGSHIIIHKALSQSVFTKSVIQVKFNYFHKLKCSVWE
jgi:hypothetical protein